MSIKTEMESCNTQKAMPMRVLLPKPNCYDLVFFSSRMHCDIKCGADMDTGGLWCNDLVLQTSVPRQRRAECQSSQHYQQVRMSWLLLGAK